VALHIIIDLLVVLILAFCVWSGYKKGLIMTVLGVVIMIVSIYGARAIAGRYTDLVADSMAPILSWVTDDAVDEAHAEAARLGQAPVSTDSPAVTLEKNRAMAGTAFSFLGVLDNEVYPLADRVQDWIQETGENFRSGVSHVFLKLVSYVLLFIAAYIVLTALLMLLAQLIASFFEIPPLKLIDTIGGLAAGLIFGGVLLFIAGWALRYTGLLIPPEVLEQTVFARFFISSNPLANMLAPIL
jgi:uncharacterized membrane protein required for colicin V production